MDAAFPKCEFMAGRRMCKNERRVWRATAPHSWSGRTTTDARWHSRQERLMNVADLEEAGPDAL